MGPRPSKAVHRRAAKRRATEKRAAQGRAAQRCRQARRRVGRVSYYRHHGAWYVYYREAGRPVRKRAGRSETEAAVIAARLNAQLASAAPTYFSFTPLTIAELRARFLDHHEHVLRSSLATVSRYRTATQHLENFASQLGPSQKAHDIVGDDFVRYLRTIRIAPNGHAHSRRRPLRDKGVRYILETCRAMYTYAAKKRHMPPYADNPLAELAGKRIRIEDAKRIFVFDAESEQRFFEQADPWSFAIHLTLAKTGLRVGELVHLWIEDLDLAGGWLQVRNQPELLWRIKTGRERAVPLVEELVLVLRRLIGSRRSGLVFSRQKFAASAPPLAGRNRSQLAELLERRVAEAEHAQALSRTDKARIAQCLWQDAGAVRPDRIRTSFIRIAAQIGLAHATCPKSWRHTFATLLQDAGVDPLVRQLVLGHAPSSPGTGALGMTSVYTHTRPETLRREIERAVRLWPATLELVGKLGGDPAVT